MKCEDKAKCVASEDVSPDLSPAHQSFLRKTEHFFCGIHHSCTLSTLSTLTLHKPSVLDIIHVYAECIVRLN